MNYMGIRLRTESGIDLALSNEFKNVFEVEDAVEDSIDGKDLLKKLKRTNNYLKSIILERETEDLIRFKCISIMCDNVSYLVINK